MIVPGWDDGDEGASSSVVPDIYGGDGGDERDGRLLVGKAYLMNSDKIISLTPADNWTAEFASLPDRSKTWRFPVIGWALIETTYEDGEVNTSVEPMMVVDGTHVMYLTEYHADLATAVPPERATLTGLVQHAD